MENRKVNWAGFLGITNGIAVMVSALKKKGWRIQARKQGFLTLNRLTSLPMFPDHLLSGNSRCLGDAAGCRKSQANLGPFGAF